MKHIQLEYAEVQGLRQLVFQLRKDAIESNAPVWIKYCDVYLGILETRLNEAVMKNA